MGIADDIKQVSKGWRWTRRPMVPASVEREAELPHDFPTGWVRTPAGKVAREVAQRWGLGPVLNLEVSVSVTGGDILKRLTPPVIFVLNHSSHLDAATIVTSLPTEWRRKTAVGAAADYFFDVWYRSVATTLFFNAFPIARGGGLRSARHARKLLSEGWSLVLFPEGTRTADGWVGEFRTGAAWLAIEAGVPVVPVALTGTYQAMPRGRSWPKAGRPPVGVRFGSPIWAEDGERPQVYSERLRRGLGAVIEEERTDWWGTIRAEAESELLDPGGPPAAQWRRMWESSRPARRRHRRSVWKPEKDEWTSEALWPASQWPGSSPAAGPDVGSQPAGPDGNGKP